jgi:endonuclease/exonuclease/phosphatase family metal-dependent hydrolase
MKLLTWNIQAGIGTRRYRDYLLHAHRQVIHTPAKAATLRDIATQITPYDLVCLQEIDLGGRRAGFRSQLDIIAAQSGHAHMAVQQNRIVPGISRHGNAILSRWPLRLVRDLKLPGPVAGRGCLIVDVDSPVAVRVACLHLSLGASAQLAQLAAIADALRDTGAWLAMGDFNCGSASEPLNAFCEMTGGRLAAPSPSTYPSWRPRRDYDHIVSCGAISLSHYRAEPPMLSDHLAVSACLRGEVVARD